MGNRSSRYKQRREAKRAECQKTLDLWMAAVYGVKEEDIQFQPSPQHHRQERKQQPKVQGGIKAEQHIKKAGLVEETLDLLCGQGIKVKLIVGGAFYPTIDSHAHSATTKGTKKAHQGAQPRATIIGSPRPVKETDCYLRLTIEKDYLFVVPAESDHSNKPSNVLSAASKTGLDRSTINAVVHGVGAVMATLPHPPGRSGGSTPNFVFCPIESSPRPQKGDGLDGSRSRREKKSQLTLRELEALDRQRGFTRSLSVGTQALALREEVDARGRRTLLLEDAAALAAAAAAAAAAKAASLTPRGNRRSHRVAPPQCTADRAGGALRLAAVAGEGEGEGGAAAAAAAAHRELRRRLRLAVREGRRRRSYCDGPALDYDALGGEGL